MLQKLDIRKLSDLIFCLGDSNLNLRDSNPLLDFIALDSNPISGDSNPWNSHWLLTSKDIEWFESIYERFESISLFSVLSSIFLKWFESFRRNLNPTSRLYFWLWFGLGDSNPLERDTNLNCQYCFRLCFDLGDSNPHRGIRIQTSSFISVCKLTLQIRIRLRGIRIRTVENGFQEF